MRGQAWLGAATVLVAALAALPSAFEEADGDGEGGLADAGGGEPAPPAWLPASGGLAPRARGRSARVQRGGARPTGPEAGLAPDGGYAQGLALDARLRHAQAARAYDAALAELDGLRAVTEPDRDAVAGWRGKIEWQRALSEQILEQAAYASVMPTSVLARYHLAVAYHEKFLSVRAFAGRPPRALFEEAERSYREALALDGRHAAARLGLAALYAAVGRMREARGELARIGARKEDPELAPQVAAYFAAAGEPEEALVYLARALAHEPSLRDWAAHANDFDPLRRDPRFVALLADAEARDQGTEE